MKHQSGIYARTNIQGQTRWYVRLVVNGKYRRFAPRGGFLSKKEATAFATRARADISRGIFFPDQFDRDPVPLGRLLAEQTARLPATANRKNDVMYERWWSHSYGALDARTLGTATLAEARQRLHEAGKSPQTIHHYLKFLRHRLALAVRDDLLDKNPFDKFRMPSVRNLRCRYYGQDERRTLYAALDPEWRDAAEIAGLTGLRWSEQFTLRKSQLHLDQAYLELPQTKAGQSQIRLLNTRAVELLRRQIDRHPNNTWVYPSPTGRHHIDHSDFLRSYWIPARKAAGVANARWNDWRHTFASDLTMAGHSDRTVADLLGHTTTKMVKRYAHLTAAHLRQAVESVSPDRKAK